MCFRYKPHCVEATKTSSLKYSPRLRTSRSQGRSQASTSPRDAARGRSRKPATGKSGNVSPAHSYTTFSRVQQIHRIRGVRRVLHANVLLHSTSTDCWRRSEMPDQTTQGQDYDSSTSTSSCGNPQYQQPTGATQESHVLSPWACCSRRHWQPSRSRRRFGRTGCPQTSVDHNHNGTSARHVYLWTRKQRPNTNTFVRISDEQGCKLQTSHRSGPTGFVAFLCMGYVVRFAMRRSALLRLRVQQGEVKQASIRNLHGVLHFILHFKGSTLETYTPLLHAHIDM